MTMNAEIMYKIPQWVKFLLTLLTLAMAGFFVVLGLNYNQLMPDAPNIFSYFFYVISFVAFVATYGFLRGRRSYILKHLQWVYIFLARC